MNIPHLVGAIRSVIGPGRHLLHEPLMIGNEEKYVKEVLASGHLSAGPWVERFEYEFAKLIGAKHAVAVINATSGLHAVITVMPKLAEYRIPSLSFVATANAVAYGGHKIRFVEFYTYCDVAVDFLGHPHFNVGAVIQDAAQSMGSKFHGSYTGSHGTAVFSFNQNKIITTGGGGMITTDNEAMAKELKHLVTTARVWHKWETSHNSVAWNYRMSDLSAAVGVAQLEQFSTILKAKRALGHKYIEVLSEVEGITPIVERERTQSNFWLNAFVLKDHTRRDEVLDALHAEGILARPLWTPIHRLPMYSHCEKNDLTDTDAYWQSVICLPSSPKLGLQHA